MKTVKGTVLCCMSISLAIVALILAAIGVSAENERMERESRKIKRIQHHTNEWRDAK